MKDPKKEETIFIEDDTGSALYKRDFWSTENLKYFAARRPAREAEAGFTRYALHECRHDHGDIPDRAGHLAIRRPA